MNIELNNIYGDFPNEPCVFAACDSKYFVDHASPFVNSAHKVGKPAHVHVVNPTNEVFDLVKRYKEKILWDKNEVDYGQFHGHMSWSFNGKKLAYSKYHYGKNQSLVYDVKIYDRDLGKHSWLTNSERATYPTWIDSNKVAYVSHFNNVSNIFIRSLDKKEVRNLTNFTNNTQITFLAISPDRNQIAFAMNPENGNMDIYTCLLYTSPSPRD